VRDKNGMKKKRILHLSPFFYPEAISTGRFNTILTLALRDRGYEVTVICSHPLYPAWKPTFSDDKLEGIKIIRGGLYMRYSSKQMLRRMLLESWYAMFSLYWVFRLRKKVDIVIAHFPPTFFCLPVTFLLPRHVVGVVTDLQYLYLASRQGIIASIAKKIVKFFERLVFKRVSKLVFMSRSMKDYVSREFNIPLEQAIVQYPSTTIMKQADCGQALDKIFNKQSVNVVYSGALAEKQNPLLMLKIFEKTCHNVPQSQFYIFSQGHYFEEMQKTLEPQLKERIQFFPFVAEECLAKLYEYSDIQVIPQKLGTSEGSTPSKVPNLMSCYTPIFAITDKNRELEEVLAHYPRSCVVNTEDIAIVAEKLGKFCHKVKKISHLATEEREAIDNFLETRFSMETFINHLIS